MVEYNFMVCMCVCLLRQNKRKTEHNIDECFLPAILESHNTNTQANYELNEVIFWFIKSQTVNLTIFIHLNYGSNQVISIKYACGTLCSILSLSHNDWCAAKALHVKSTTQYWAKRKK